MERENDDYEKLACINEQLGMLVGICRDIRSLMMMVIACWVIVEILGL